MQTQETINDVTMTFEEEKLFFNILQFALWQTPVKCEGKSIRWDVILENMIRQSIVGVEGGALLKLKDQLNYPEEFQLRLQKKTNTLLKKNILHNFDLINLFNHFYGLGYRPILLKGQGNAAHYPNPLERASGDIDMYIGRKDYEKARLDMISLVGDDNANKSTERDKHYEVKYNETIVELHKYVLYWKRKSTRAYGDSFCTKYLDDPSIKETVTINGVDIAVPPIQFNVVYVFCHLYFHFLGIGIGLRHLSDWAMLLHYAHINNLLDIDQLKKDLEGLDVLTGWQLMGTVLVNKIGLPQNEFPFYDAKKEKKLPLLLKDIFAEGNFGKYGGRINKANRNRSFLSRKFHSFFDGTSRYLFLFNVAPSDALLNFRYFLYDAYKRLTGKDKVKRNE